MAEEESPKRFRIKQEVVIAGALIAAVATIGAAYITANAGKDDKANSAALVRECIGQHKLDKSQTKTRPKQTKDEYGESQWVTYYKRCDWPPGPGADKTGYSEFKVTERLGPGEVEASGVTTADVIESTCSELEVSYRISAQGYHESLKPFRSMPNRVVLYTGKAWQSTSEAPLPFDYESDELVVLLSNKERLDSVRCVA